MKQVDYLIFDVSGLLYRTYYGAKNAPMRRKSSLFEDDDDDDRLDENAIANFALHTALVSMNKFFKQFKPKQVVACFDRPNNWRKQYMASDLAISPLQYKGQRRQNMTKEQKAEYGKLLEHMAEFEQLLEKETGIFTLAADGLEADDCIAAWCQMHPDAMKVIASNDSDLMQLIDDNTRVCSYTTSEFIECENPKFFLFEKIFRGDVADNIASAYPRIRTAKLQKMFEDKYQLANVLNEPYIGPNTDESLKVKDAFEENQLIMDLTMQPPAIRKLMESTVEKEKNKTQRFDFWKFSAFCAQRKLNHISSSLATFRPMLVGGYKNVK